MYCIEWAQWMSTCECSSHLVLEVRARAQWGGARRVARTRGVAPNEARAEWQRVNDARAHRTLLLLLVGRRRGANGTTARRRAALLQLRAAGVQREQEPPVRLEVWGMKSIQFSGVYSRFRAHTIKLSSSFNLLQLKFYFWTQARSSFSG